jgi:hypothetical protein
MLNYTIKKTEIYSFENNILIGYGINLSFQNNKNITFEELQSLNDFNSCLTFFSNQNYYSILFQVELIRKIISKEIISFIIPFEGIGATFLINKSGVCIDDNNLKIKLKEYIEILKIIKNEYETLYTKYPNQKNNDYENYQITSKENNFEYFLEKTIVKSQNL